MAESCVAFMGFKRSSVRKLGFAVVLHIHSLDNFPASSNGVFFKVKHPKKSKEPPYWSNTKYCEKASVVFEENVALMADLFADNKTHVLQSHHLRISVRQKTRKTFERIGIVLIDLAEIANKREFTQRFLLQKTQYNASLKISVKVQQTAGDPQFVCPSSSVPTSGLFMDSTDMDDVLFDRSNSIMSAEGQMIRIAGLGDVSIAQMKEAQGAINELLDEDSDEG
ncbi:hypothetical protein J8273_1170 [Carpediemonas membranifera]|uniref:C2 NT-type domain-containing protein n=1 Tax=Carpediemonas membranifera TaxID=201153 RepID=A0A8J6EBI1_9EUKA|nr:hypothetical protein J8273_1170 [Carpediemonas membranifera]|eukprot:KAG9397255.1 hypothetical protein J8273_1170 [Carpediemonas membranifera]